MKKSLRKSGFRVIPEGKFINFNAHEPDSLNWNWTSVHICIKVMVVDLLLKMNRDWILFAARLVLFGQATPSRHRPPRPHSLVALSRREKREFSRKKPTIFLLGCLFCFYDIFKCVQTTSTYITDFLLCVCVYDWLIALTKTNLTFS